jgi:hypothetical protein
MSGIPAYFRTPALKLVTVTVGGQLERFELFHPVQLNRKKVVSKSGELSQEWRFTGLLAPSRSLPGLVPAAQPCGHRVSHKWAPDAPGHLQDAIFGRHCHTNQPQSPRGDAFQAFGGTRGRGAGPVNHSCLCVLAASAYATSASTPGLVRAQERTLVISDWGGDWNERTIQLLKDVRARR